MLEYMHACVHACTYTCMHIYMHAWITEELPYSAIIGLRLFHHVGLYRTGVWNVLWERLAFYEGLETVIVSNEGVGVILENEYLE